MIRLLDKKRELGMLEQLFDLLYDNMSAIAPTGLTYEEEKNKWLSAVGPAMEKDARQILILTDGEKIAGYCQYYVSGRTLMVEEIQIRRLYRSSSAFVSLLRFLEKLLPEDTAFLEAYVDRRNTRSQKLMERLGMECIGEDGQFLHYRGSLPGILARFGRKRRH